MGKAGLENPPLTVEESIAGQLRLVEALTHEHSGRYWQYDGKEILW